MYIRPCDEEQCYQFTDPTLKELVLLKVSTQWFDIGLQLGLEESELMTIEYNNPRDLKACVRNMFSHWLRSTKDPSYQVVLEALIAAGDENAAQELCHKFGKFQPVC